VGPVGPVAPVSPLALSSAQLLLLLLGSELLFAFTAIQEAPVLARYTASSTE